MHKKIILVGIGLALLFMFSTNHKSKTVKMSFPDSFSKETIKWLMWYESLSYEDKKATSYVSKELIEAMENGYEYELAE